MVQHDQDEEQQHQQAESEPQMSNTIVEWDLSSAGDNRNLVDSSYKWNYGPKDRQDINEWDLGIIDSASIALKNEWDLNRTDHANDLERDWDLGDTKYHTIKASEYIMD